MPLTNPQLQDRIATLLSPIDSRVSVWGQPTPAAPIVMAYEFETAQPPDLWANFSGWTAMSEAEKAALKSVLAEYSEIINVSFVENGVDAPAIAEPDINFGKVGFSPGTGGQGGFNYSFSTDGGGNVTSKTWDSYAVFNSSLNLADAAERNLMLHEFGHAMGLKHPGNYDVGGNLPPAPFLPADEDNNHYSVMSYNADPDGSVFPEHLMLYDIAALQKRWGANYTTRSGNDVYTGPRSGPLDVIWDGGGSDRISAAGKSEPVIIDLRAGNFSSLGAGATLAIAYGVRIESAIGGDGNDRLTGNKVANLLDGGAGRDVMSGGRGNDVYLVQSPRDVIREKPQAGIDTERSTVTDTLSANVENLHLIGGRAVDAFGNALNNVLTGNRAGNRLDGGGGADTLSGGGGNDGYAVDDAGDRVRESANSGIDRVSSSISHSLAANVENLTLTGSADSLGNGNALNNTLIGNSGGNLLAGRGGDDRIGGGDGADTLAGGSGHDTLIGGNGADIFDYNRLDDSGQASGTRDRINDFIVNVDRIDLSSIDAVPGGADNPFAFMGTAGFTAPGQLRLVQQNGAVLVALNTIGASGAEAAITLVGLLAGNLDAGDFIL